MAVIAAFELDGDIASGILSDRQFDIIVFAASIQYFRLPDEILDHCLHYLKPSGEIHIIDTMFYPPKAITGAKERTAQYFCSMGYPEMACHYFHHTLSPISQFTHKILYNPDSFWTRFSKYRVPFPWILLRIESTVKRAPGPRNHGRVARFLCMVYL